MKKRDIEILNKFLKENISIYLFSFNTNEENHDEFYFYYKGYFITAINEKGEGYDEDTFYFFEPALKFYKSINEKDQEKLDKLILKNNVNNF